jgi:TPR repeat protein
MDAYRDNRDPELCTQLLPKTKPIASKASNTNSPLAISSSLATACRSPAGGLVEDAMDAYRDNKTLAFSPQLRGPQVVLENPFLSLPIDDFAETTRKAKLGDKVAQFNLGSIYLFSKEPRQDYRAAMNWYLKAAGQGHTGAQNAIGFMYDYGRGVPKNCRQAWVWYQKSANLGNASAQCQIGYMYGNGLGVSQDYRQAMEWYLKAANQGKSPALYSVGHMYEMGLGVPQDYRQAMEWYLKAADQGDVSAQRKIGDCYRQGHSVPQDY